MGRGVAQLRIFPERRDYEKFIGAVQRGLEYGKAHCLAWAMLPTHYHLLLRTGAAPLSGVMGRILTSYAVGFNRRHHRHGHVFEYRYQSLLCDEETYA